VNSKQVCSPWSLLELDCDTLNRLTSGPLGSYTYGDTHHLHAATSVSSGYTARL
jgi:hypothetical protein